MLLDASLPTLPAEEISFHPSSGADWNGHVFLWRGGIYRAVRESRAPFYLELLRRGVLDALSKRHLLIETEIAPYRLAEYPLILAHRRVPFVTYPVEWSRGMLKAAALAVIDLELALCEHGLSNHDAHPWNVLFDGRKPVFVDLGAILPVESAEFWPDEGRNHLWPAFSQFRECFWNPLQLMSWRQHRIARALLLDYKGVKDWERHALSPRPWERWTAAAGRKARHLTAELSAKRGRTRPAEWGAGSVRDARFVAARRDYLTRIRAQVEDISLPAIAPPPVGAASAVAVGNILDSLDQASVLVFADSVSLDTSGRAESVVMLDADEDRTDRRAMAQTKAPSFLPLVMEFRSPTPAVGPCNRWLASANERLQCDVVVCLQSIRDLVFGTYLTFDQIAKTMAMFSRRYAVLSFDAFVTDGLRDAQAEHFTWYTESNLMDSLRRHFPKVERQSLARGTVQLVCSRV